MVQTIISVNVIDDMNRIVDEQSPMKKPFLELVFESGETQNISLNLGEMIGAIAKGAKQRFHLD